MPDDDKQQLPSLWLKLAPDIRLDLIGVLHRIRTGEDPNSWDDWLMTLETLFIAFAQGQTERIQMAFYKIHAANAAENLDDELKKLLEAEE